MRLWRSEQPRRPIAHVARELGIHPEALRTWIRQDEADRGERDRPADHRRAARSCGGCARRTPSCAAPMRSCEAASAYFAQELDPTRRRS